MAKGDSDNAMLPTKPRIVVGLDFGTTYSGFAYAHVSDPDRIHTYYDYPKNAEEKPYCKTLTACYYKSLVVSPSSKEPDPKTIWKLQSWGYPAYTDYKCDIQALDKYQKAQELQIPSVGSSSHTFQLDKSDLLAPLVPKARSEGGFLSRLKFFSSRDTSQHGASNGVAPLIPQAQSVGVFLSRFKLHLASESIKASSATPLPPGLTIAQVITDYLRELGGLVLKHLQSIYSTHFSNEMVQWCITVPSIWDNCAKVTMKTCMAAAGLVNTHHPVIIVLEPEAAAFHCQRKMDKVVLEAGNKLFVVDIGGGISDIVVQEVVKPQCQVKEVTMSLGGLCGGTYMDSLFLRFLKRKVGEACVFECFRKHPNVYRQLMKEWEHTKFNFDNQNVTVMNLPKKLAAEWARSDVESGHRGSQEYGKLEISSTEMQYILDPIVQQNVDLIEQQMVEAGGKVRVLAMVGGFLESPYLLRRIREAFEDAAEIIVCPCNPGSAVCQGAVALALNSNAVVSRMCTRTYGFETCLHFEEGIDSIESLDTFYGGTQYCITRFVVLVKKGDVVPMDKVLTKLITPIGKGRTSLRLDLFNCDDVLPPRYTTDKRMQKEGRAVIDISGDMELEEHREIEVSMCFEGSILEVKARAVNFSAWQVQLPVEVDYLLT